MLEELLKSLGEAEYNIEWRYEASTNSIIIRLWKMFGERRYTLMQRVCFEDLYYGPGSQSMFEFNMVRIIRELVKRFEHDIQECAQP